VRDLLPHGSGLLVLAGPLDGRDTGYRLLSLAAPGALPADLGIPLPDRAEGVAVWGSDLLVVTDGDGEPGTTCIAPANWIRVPLPAP
jgi:hypothetical protein